MFGVAISLIVITKDIHIVVLRRIVFTLIIQ